MSLALVQTSEGNWDVQVNATRNPIAEACALSLLCEARARPNEIRNGRDPSGWWGNSYPSPSGFELGSRLWQLKGEPLIDATLERAKTFAIEALQWMLDDNIFKSIDVSSERVSDTVLGIALIGTRPDGSDFSGYWEIVLDGV